jgi:hypothetical protein
LGTGLKGENMEQRKNKPERYEELYCLEIRRYKNNNTKDEIERFYKLGKATNVEQRLNKTKKDHTPIGKVDYVNDVSLIWRSGDNGLFWGDRLTSKMEKALLNMISKSLHPYKGKGIGKTEMFLADKISNIKMVDKIQNCMREISAKIRYGKKPIVNENQFNTLFKNKEL